MDGIGTLVLISVIMFAVLGAITVLAHIYNLNNIKSKTVGDGQHGTARWARKDEIKKVYKRRYFLGLRSCNTFVNIFPDDVPVLMFIRLCVVPLHLILESADLRFVFCGYSPIEDNPSLSVFVKQQVWIKWCAVIHDRSLLS